MKVNLLSVILAIVLALVLFGSGYYLARAQSKSVTEKMMIALSDSLRNVVYNEMAILRATIEEKTDTVYKFGRITDRDVEIVYVPTKDSLAYQYFFSDKSDLLDIKDTMLVQNNLISEHRRTVKLDTPVINTVTIYRDTVRIDKPVPVYTNTASFYVGADLQHYNDRVLQFAYNPKINANLMLGYIDKKRNMLYVTKSLNNLETFAIGYGYKFR